MTAPTPATLTKTAFAAHIGVAKSYVSKLGNTGRLVLTSDGLVDVAESLAKIKSSNGAPERSPDIMVPPAFADQRDRGDRLRNELLEMEVGERRGELLKAQDVRAVVVAAATTLRSRLEALPDQIGPQLAATADEQQVRNLLASEVEVVLQELAHQFGKFAQEKA
jgi:hypothetical protein